MLKITKRDILAVVRTDSKKLISTLETLRKKYPYAGFKRKGSSISHNGKLDEILMFDLMEEYNINIVLGRVRK